MDPPWQKKPGETRAPITEIFLEEVRRHFDFLLTEHGFVGPEQVGVNPAYGLPRPSAIYHSPSLAVEAMLVFGPMSDKYVATSLAREVDAKRVTADLGEVYVAAGLGPVQHVRSSAHTTHAVAKSLATHGAALRRVVPLVLAPNGDLLLRGVPVQPARRPAVTHTPEMPDPPLRPVQAPEA